MYFKNQGVENTENTIKLAVDTAKKRGIKYIVVASHEGDTAKLLKNCGLNIVVITHAFGHKILGENEMREDVKKELQSFGFKVYTSSHVLSGAERAISIKFGGVSPVEIVAYTLRMFGQGTKVAVEISTMALDAGLVPFDEDIIAIGGSGKGADTAVIIRPANAMDIFNTRIKEIICKPL
ncbi:pyruvate kinase alpha/beta domain-containing protein [Clostridium rectalis]|uniref:pyruvate kinase alpha/beta domain-containing protein n=1 Tax=Clostridium rectalis TaxID=2040295 RepID=UPI000F63F134|nr:pyruvate kinase alpha/beta domain-containing protein [Clostridium rectalis]